MNIKKKLFSDLQKIWEKENKVKKFLPGKSIVPVSGKVIDFDEIKLMIESSLDGWLTTGRFNKLFEKTIAQETGSKIAFTVNSGSSANLVAFSTLTSPKLKDRQIKPGDEVITAAAGFPTTVNPIIQNRAVPVFIDVDIPTYNILPENVEKAISKKTKAIMVAHTLGNPYNIKKIREICDKYNLWLIQDSCDALGAEYDNKKLGHYGDIGTLSFYPAHHITMGEGGAVFFNNIRLKKIAESFRDWGRDCYCETGMDNTCGKRFGWKLGNLPEGYDHKYTYSHMGYNLKITDMQAACGLAQTKKLNYFVKKRRDNFNYLNKLMKNLEEYFILPKETPKSKASWFGYLITLRDNQSFTRNQLVKYLNEHKIGTRLLFSGNITKQPFMENVNYLVNQELKNTDKIMNDTFWVGVYPGLDICHLEYIYEIIKKFISKVT
ncbi:lipopolysaccharide biosynthesis protein RfbH [Candidatus Pelagibacter sp.]|nr:lipopolysaccharide biosynthesis protein RfbH [Candidatus Pelagibacter sp.]MDA9754485.1 lipopolysaccharide biosynthesis protein RfbH [Candidatus Pelagibacter sp.]